ncbi:hypothetical protein DRJ25_02840 [Candidatus Woesearchaeota archaeon]|nr:MAG: hypothetical protein DRJ25_02840 [Candidatus Woesearchaeota archaeon]
MSGLFTKIKRYFTDASVRDFYKELRQFYKENITDKKRLKKLRKKSKLEEGVMLFFDIVLPTAFEAATMTYAFLTKQPDVGAIGILSGELIRYFSKMSSKELRAKRSIEMVNIMYENILNQQNEPKYSEDAMNIKNIEKGPNSDETDAIIKEIIKSTEQESWKQGLYDFSGDWWKEGKKPKGMEED